MEFPRNDPSEPVLPRVESVFTRVPRRVLIPILLCIVFVPIGHTLALAIIAGVVAVVSAVAYGDIKRVGHDEDARNLRTKIVIYTLLCVLALGIMTATKKLSRYRANKLIVAIESYKSEHGDYPERLSQLVPRYVESVPQANYTFFGDFFYHKDVRGGDASAWLYYVTLPPFDGPTYRFDRRRWSDEPE